MKIDDMLKREDFFHILEATINTHFKYSGIAIEVSDRQPKKKRQSLIYMRN